MYVIRLLIAFLTLWLVFGLRGIDVGIDTVNYDRIFYGVNYKVGYDYIEPGWYFINYLVGTVFHSDFQCLLLIVGLLLIVPVVYVGKKETKNILLMLLIYYSLGFYTASFNIMRQSLAMSYVLLFYSLYSDKRYFYALIAFGIAISFHSSSIFSLVVLFPFIPTKRTSLILIVSAFVIGVIAYKFFPVLANYSFIYSSYLSNAETLFRDDILLAIIITLFLDVFAILIIYNLDTDALKNNWYKLFIYSIIVINILLSVHYGARIYNILAIGQMVFFTNILTRNSKNKGRLSVFCWTYFIILFAKMMITNANGIMPYSMM